MMSINIEQRGQMMNNHYWSSKGKHFSTIDVSQLTYLIVYSAFPITLTGNPKVTIGQFNLSMTSSFPVGSSGLGANSEPLFANIDGNLL